MRKLTKFGVTALTVVTLAAPFSAPLIAQAVQEGVGDSGVYTNISNRIHIDIRHNGWRETTWLVSSHRAVGTTAISAPGSVDTRHTTTAQFRNRTTGSISGQRTHTASVSTRAETPWLAAGSLSHVAETFWSWP
ncbi:MAG: hypothetical protein FWG67_00825 [Defluviitaleaceae bacterium]|nr:hypothetical protein [Defluviitaleaceae bacterium]